MGKFANWALIVIGIFLIIVGMMGAGGIPLIMGFLVAVVNMYLEYLRIQQEGA